MTEQDVGSGALLARFLSQLLGFTNCCDKLLPRESLGTAIRLSSRISAHPTRAWRAIAVMPQHLVVPFGATAGVHDLRMTVSFRFRSLE